VLSAQSAVSSKSYCRHPRCDAIIGSKRTHYIYWAYNNKHREATAAAAGEDEDEVDAEKRREEEGKFHEVRIALQ
jgi:hypothetical protein